MLTTTALLTSMLVITGPRTPTTENAPTKRGSICLVSAIYEVDVPAKQAGVLMDLSVREGAQITLDQPLAKIDDRDAAARESAARFEHEVATMNAENKIPVEIATKAHAVSVKEHDKALEANANLPNTVGQTELDRLELRAAQLGFEVDQAQHELDVAEKTQGARKAQWEVAQRDVTDRQVKSPCNGMIADIYAYKGEWLQQGAPILRVIQMDTLKVEAFLHSDERAPHEVLGCKATVTVPLAGEAVVFEDCEVTFVSAEVEPTGQFRVAVDLINRQAKGPDGQEHWILRPGMQGTIEVHRE